MKRRNWTRRNVIVGMGAPALASPFAARAQRPGATVIGVLSSASQDASADALAAFRRGLSEAGFNEGAGLTIEYRWAEGRYDRLPALAAELVQRPVAVIVALGGDGPALAAKAATAVIPIIFVSGGEPIRAGLVKSLARPGGNVTGVSWIATALTAKRLELLRELLPRVNLIGVLVNPNYPDIDLQLKEINGAAQSTGQRIVVAEARTESGIEAAFATLGRAPVDALLVANDPFFYSRPDTIVGLAARYALPACYFERKFAASGGLMTYGTSLTDANRQAGLYTGRVLKGASPADLPVLQPTKFELVINLKTAKTLDLAVPPLLLAQVDEVIE